MSDNLWIWNDPVEGPAPVEGDSRPWRGWLRRGTYAEIPEGVVGYPLGSGVPEVREDVKEHFNRSAGRVISSRADRDEMCRREGMRVAECSNPEQSLKEHEARRSDRIRHPEKHGGQNLQDFMYETFRTAGGDKREVREAIEASKQQDAMMKRKWDKGEVRR